MDFQEWEMRFESQLSELERKNKRIDPAHDLTHFARVVKTAKDLAKQEGARLEVVVPAAWLHDLVNIPKEDPRRSEASRLSAQAALDLLKKMGYPEQFFNEIGHAIEAHSYSAQIAPRTIEAKVVQDADRLDGLGAIGIARCFVVAGVLGRRIYDPQQPFASSRSWDDQENTLDHFYVKLFKTAETLQTAAGRAEGGRRVELMRLYLQELAREIR